MISAVFGHPSGGDVPIRSPEPGDRTYEYSCNRRDSSETEVAKHRTTDADPALEKVADILPDAYRGIPHHKIGQTLLFREDEILEWMQGNKVA
jgi:hypothetical protein